MQSEHLTHRLKKAKENGKAVISQASRQDLIVVKSHEGKSVVAPVEHVTENFVSEVQYVVTPTNNGSFGTYFQSDNNQMEFVVRHEHRHLVRGFLKLTISVSSSSVNLAPLYLWFDYIDWWANGNSEQLNRMYGTLLHKLWNSLMSEDQRRYFASEGGFEPYNCFAEPMSIPSGGTRTFRIPIYLPGTDERHPFPLGKLKNDLTLRLMSRDPKESGSGTVTLTEAKLILTNEMYPQREVDELNNSTGSAPIERRVLSCLRMSETGVVQTAGTAIQPVQLTGFANFDLLALFHTTRSSNTSNSSGALRKFSYLGDNGSFSLELPGNNSLLSEGSNVTYLGDWMFHQADKIPNTPYNRSHPSVDIWWTDPRVLFDHVSTNAYPCSGLELYKETPGTAGTQEVQTIGLANAANDGGYYNLSFGESTTYQLAYNHSADNIATEVNRMPSMKRLGLSVSVSGTAAGTSIVFTFSPPGPIPYPIIMLPVSLNDGSVAETGAGTAITTPGIRGSVNATYVKDHYALIYRTMVIDNGVVKSYDRNY